MQVVFRVSMRVTGFCEYLYWCVCGLFVMGRDRWCNPN